MRNLWDNLDYEAKGVICSFASVAGIITLGTIGLALGVKFGKLIGAW